MNTHSEFNNKIAVVSGAAKGIGAAVCESLEQAGAIVVKLDIALQNDHQQRHYQVDLSDAQQVDNAIEHIEQNVGEIDFLANVAGILHMGSVLDSTIDEWQQTFAVNTFGALNLCRAVGKKMRDRRRGVIVAVGSNASGVPRMNMGSYAASKAATTQLVKCLGLELAEYGIRCNVVAPGSTDTDMQRQLWNDETGAEQVIKGSLEGYRLGIPLKRIATPEKIAQVVNFLLSTNASHITLETVTVDGGATLGC